MTNTYDANGYLVKVGKLRGNYGQPPIRGETTARCPLNWVDFFCVSGLAGDFCLTSLGWRSTFIVWLLNFPRINLLGERRKGAWRSFR